MFKEIFKNNMVLETSCRDIFLGIKLFPRLDEKYSSTFEGKDDVILSQTNRTMKLAHIQSSTITKLSIYSDNGYYYIFFIFDEYNKLLTKNLIFTDCPTHLNIKTYEYKTLNVSTDIDEFMFEYNLDSKVSLSINELKEVHKDVLYIIDILNSCTKE